MAQDYTRLREFVESTPWHKFLGVRVEALRQGYARLHLPFRPEWAGNTERGSLHGGVLASLADICAISTLWTLSGEQALSSTVDLKVDYLRPAPLEDMVAEGEIRMRGKRLGNVVVSLRSAGDPDRIVAEARAVCYTVPGDGRAE